MEIRADVLDNLLSFLEDMVEGEVARTEFDEIVQHHVMQCARHCMNTFRKAQLG